MKYDEIYADKFACKHIKDKVPLEQAIQYSKKRMQMLEVNSKNIASNFENKMWKYIGAKAYNLWYIALDLHPSDESRVKKLERVLKERFQQ
jgi:Zn-dependent protease with chaperone function